MHEKSDFNRRTLDNAEGQLVSLPRHARLILAWLVNGQFSLTAQKETSRFES